MGEPHLHFWMRVLKGRVAHWNTKKPLRLGMNAITTSTSNCRMTWHWAECQCCDENSPRAVELTLKDSLWGVKMTPNTQDGNFLLHLNKLTSSSQRSPDVQHTNQYNPGSEGSMHFLFTKAPCTSYIPFFSLILMVIWKIWVASIFFYQARYWSPPSSTLSKMHGQNKEVVLCCTKLGSHSWMALRSALMPSF